MNEKKIKIIRYQKEDHGEFLFEIYHNEKYREFFRRIPIGWSKENILNFEQMTNSQLFAVIVGECFVGFAIVTDIDNFELSAHIGLVLLEHYQDKKIGDLKIAFLAMYELTKMVFGKSTIRKVKMKFLKKRTDIEESLKNGGFKKEGDYESSIKFNGRFEDELEYAMTEEMFWRKYG